MSIILKELMENRDDGYKAFHSRLIPNIDSTTLLGVRGPVCKAIAKKYASALEGAEFMGALPHKYYDENLVHGYMLGFLKDDDVMDKIKTFLPYMDNWAVVDSTVSNLKNFFKIPEDVFDLVKNTLSSDEEYTVRFGIVVLLCYYLTDKHACEAIRLVKSISSGKFYIKMAQAWFFATALTKYYELALVVIENRELDTWVHNKAIQKAKESYRITDDRKAYLSTLKIKNN